MLTRLKLTRETKFVVFCSSSILERVLKELQEVGMMTDMYSYIIANLDMQTIELQPYQYAGTNITGIRMINPESQEVIATAGNIQKRKRNANLLEDLAVLDAWKMKLELALIVDAVKLFYETIHYLTADEKMYINATSIHCKSNDNWVGGNTIINLMKTRSVQGLTGLVKFDEGFRKDFIVDILELAPGGLLKVGDWNSTSRSINIQRPYKASLVDNTENSLFNRTFTVLITISPPYAMLKETTTQLFGNDRYEGFCIDVMEKLSKLLGFNYTFIVQEDKANGNLNKATNTWNGIIGEIVAKRADLGITDLTITSDRENAVDFTMPFMNLGISILYRKPEPVPESLFMFARPFSLSVWTMLGVSYFFVSLAFFIMGRLSPTEWQNPYPCVEEPEHLRNQFSIRNSLWFTIGALMQQGTELAPIAVSTRTLSGIWWFFVLIMVSSYTANLAAFLTVETFVTPFKNINELAAQKEIKYGAKAGGATANYFRDSNLSTYNDIWNYMVHNPQNMLSDNDEAVKKVETENYAFLMESTSIEYVIERRCSLAQVGGLLDDKGYGIAMAKDSPYRNKLSRELLKLQETGVLTSLKIKWWKEKRGGGKCSRKPEGGAATPLDLQNVGGVFLVLFVGSILGLIGSFLELSMRVYRRSKYKKLSFKEELKRELIFFIKFKQNVKEVSDSSTEDANDNKLIHKTRIEY
nr:ionotropic receptor 3 [Monochamus saltuarius]